MNNIGTVGGSIGFGPLVGQTRAVSHVRPAPAVAPRVSLFKNVANDDDGGDVEALEDAGEEEAESGRTLVSFRLVVRTFSSPSPATELTAAVNEKVLIMAV